MVIPFAYLALTLIKSKCQGEDDSLANISETMADTTDIAVSNEEQIAYGLFRLAYLDLTLTYFEGQGQDITRQ